MILEENGRFTFEESLQLRFGGLTYRQQPRYTPKAGECQRCLRT